MNLSKINKTRPSALLQLPVVHKKDLEKLKALNLKFVLSGNIREVIRFLRYKRGDRSLLQDLKTIAISRIACEAYSHSRIDIFEAFNNLLGEFDTPPLMFEYTIPKNPLLGEQKFFLKACAPFTGDNRVIIQAKFCALIFNLSLTIQSFYHRENNIIVPNITNQEDFNILFSWIWEMFHDFIPLMPRATNELIHAHILDPDFPFNIQINSYGSVASGF